MKLLHLSLIILLISSLVSCATTSQIAPKISLGMTKQEVLKICGKPYKSGAMQDPDTGEIIEGLVYREFIYDTLYGQAYSMTLDPTYVKIYLKDGKVVRYGADLDWMTASDYEGEHKIKITTDENIVIKER